MKTVSVLLSEPIEWFNETLDRIVLREPNYRIYAELGEPYAFSRTPDGADFAAARDDVIAKYVEKCVFEPNNPAVLSAVQNLKDARALRTAVLGFFRDTHPDTSGPSPA